MKTEFEDALRAFEVTTGLLVTVHDHNAGLWRYLPAYRFSHRHPVCLAVKAGSEGGRCLEFEIGRFRAEADRWLNGRVHRCHAGIVELAYRVMDSDGPLLTLFAGPARVADVTRLDLAAQASPAATSTAHLARELPAIDGAERRYLELLRQLGARLGQLLHDGRTVESDAGRGTMTRRSLVERFVQDSVYGPLPISTLADWLGVSPERARHIVVEELDAPLRVLVQRARMTGAASMIAETGLTIAQVADRFGYRDATAFSRAFRRVLGVTPSAWRARHGA